MITNPLSLMVMFKFITKKFNTFLTFVCLSDCMAIDFFLIIKGMMFKFLLTIFMTYFCGKSFFYGFGKTDESFYEKMKRIPPSQILLALKDPPPTKKDLILHWGNLPQNKKDVIKERFDMSEKLVNQICSFPPLSVHSRRALDIRARSGQFSKKLHQLGYEVIAVDPNWDEISCGCVNGSFDGVQLFPTTLQELPAELNYTFDIAVFCNFFINHNEYASFFASLNRLMKRDRKACVYLYFCYNDFDPIIRQGKKYVEMYNRFEDVSIQYDYTTFRYTKVTLRGPFDQERNYTVEDCLARMPKKKDSNYGEDEFLIISNENIGIQSFEETAKKYWISKAWRIRDAFKKGINPLDRYPHLNEKDRLFAGFYNSIFSKSCQHKIILDVYHMIKNQYRSLVSVLYKESALHQHAVRQMISRFNIFKIGIEK